MSTRERTSGGRLAQVVNRNARARLATMNVKNGSTDMMKSTGKSKKPGRGATASKSAPVKDNVNHPSHYGGKDNLYEVIKVLEVWLTKEEFTGFLKGNIHKYLARANAKGGDEDCAKAAWYNTYLTEFQKRTP